MKKLLATAAVCGLVAGVAAPAHAEESALKLNLGGHLKGYVTYVDQDDDLLGGAEQRKVDILRDTEIHFTGETTLDNGLTVGFHSEMKVQKDGDSEDIDESYAYFSGNWGRVNFGDEDGAAYLLQVAAPSADSNVDGIRQFIQPIAFDPLLLGAANTTSGIANDGFDYDNDLTNDADKITYLTPVFNGFQAGVSYTPDTDGALTAGFGTNGVNVGTNNNGLGGVSTDDVAGEYGEAYEGAVRYEGAFNNVGFAVGGGYTTVRLEEDAVGFDDFNEWNVGLDLDIGAFGIGAIYTENNGGVDDDGDSETWVIGGDYTVGAYKLGVSYLNNEQEEVGVDDTEIDRVTAGVVYSYAPGMSFRGSISHSEFETAAGDSDATAVLLGTQINF